MNMGFGSELINKNSTDQLRDIRSATAQTIATWKYAPLDALPCDRDLSRSLV